VLRNQGSFFERTKNASVTGEQHEGNKETNCGIVTQHKFTNAGFGGTDRYKRAAGTYGDQNRE